MSDVVIITEEVPGPSGQTGPAGPISVTVATAAALTAVDATMFAWGLQAAITGLKQFYSYDPTSVLTPDGNTVIAATPVGNWVVLPFSNGRGAYVVGTSTFQQGGADWAGVGAGETFTLPLLQAPQLGFGEQVTLATSFDVQSTVAAQNVSGATGNGVTPIVIAVPSTAGYQNGSRVYVVGVGGNTAANGSQTVTVVDATHLALVGTTGNGAYTTGGVVSPLDFGHFERRVTLRECRGLTLNAQGGTTDTDLTTPTEPGNTMPSLVGMSATLAIVAGILSAVVTAPANVPIRFALDYGYVRRPQPGAGPAPTLTSTSAHGGTSDGGTTGTLSGTAFTGVVSVAVVVSGTSYPASFAFVNDGTVNATFGPGPALGGVGDIVLTTANGQATLAAAYTYTPTIRSILGATIRGWYPNQNLVSDGAGHTTAWTDGSGNGQDLNLLHSTPGYNAASASITPAGPTLALAGSSQGIGRASFVLAGAPGSGIWVAVVYRTTSAGLGYVATYNSTLGVENDGVFTNTGHPTADGRGLTLAWGTVTTNSTIAASMYCDGANGAGQNGQIEVGNAAPSTTTFTRDGSLVIAASAAFTLGQDPNNPAPTSFVGEIAEVVVANAKPNATQLTALHAIWSAKYGV